MSYKFCLKSLCTGGWLLALFLLGCSEEEAVSSLPAGGPNIVLISVDSLRADHLGAYGYDRETSPTIDRLAEEGVLFETVTSSSSWTLPAHAALFTGLPDFVHGVDRGSRQLIPDRRTLAEALQSAGYRTAGIWSGPLLDPFFGFGQGFDTYWSHNGFDAETDLAVDGQIGTDKWKHQGKLSHQDVTGPAILEKVDKALAIEDDRPFFLFVHLWDVHYDYLPPSPYDTMFTSPDYAGEVDGQEMASYLELEAEDFSADDLQHMIDLYDSEIAWTDSQIGDILKRLEALGIADETLVIVTADHGEDFFEHGVFGHKHHLYDTAIRIPWVMRYPGVVSAGQRIDSPVRIIDIGPTLLEWAGAEPLPEVLGRSVLPLLEGESSYGSKGSVAELADDATQEKNLLALRTERWKIVTRAGNGEVVGLYNLVDDPLEQNNVYGVDQALTQEATRQLAVSLSELERARARHARPQLGSNRLPKAIEEQLRNLGYIGEADQAETPIWADPNPIVNCKGTPQGHLGSTTLSWNVPQATGPVEVWVGGKETGTLFTTQDIIGSKTTPRWVVDGMEFALVDLGNDSKELGRARVGVALVECPDE